MRMPSALTRFDKSVRNGARFDSSILFKDREGDRMVELVK